jgi:hypothetical protein
MKWFCCNMGKNIPNVLLIKLCNLSVLCLKYSKPDKCRSRCMYSCELLISCPWFPEACSHTGSFTLISWDPPRFIMFNFFYIFYWGYIMEKVLKFLILSDSCQNVTIENCYISVGDDCIAIKSGWDQYGIAYARPSANIVIRNLMLRSRVRWVKMVL